MDAVSEAHQRGAAPHAAYGPDGEPAAEPPAADVAVLFAMGIESGGLVDQLGDPVMLRGDSFSEHCGTLGGRQVSVVEGGVGRAAAAAATLDLIRVRKPRWVISAGFAGALTETLRRGHILLAQEIVDQEGGRWHPDLQLDAEYVSASPSLHTGRLVTVDRLIRTPADKRKLGERVEAQACDMETSAVADVCHRQQVDFLSVRIISDAVHDTLPPEIENLVEQDSWAGKLGAATGAIFKRPSSVKDMWRLKEDALKASDRLARFLVKTIEQLA